MDCSVQTAEIELCAMLLKVAVYCIFQIVFNKVHQVLITGQLLLVHMQELASDRHLDMMAGELSCCRAQATFAS